jgi:hypothetical protein
MRSFTLKSVMAHPLRFGLKLSGQDTIINRALIWGPARHVEGWKCAMAGNNWRSGKCAGADGSAERRQPALGTVRGIGAQTGVGVATIRARRTKL